MNETSLVNNPSPVSLALYRIYRHSVLLISDCEMKVFTLYELAVQTSIMRYKIKANIVSGDYLADV